MMIPQRTLSQVAMITMGTSPKGDTYNQDGSGLPLLNGPTEFGPTYPNCTLFSTDSKRECRPGDLIFCVRGSTTGRMNWADRVYSLGRGVCSIRGEATTDTRFIKYCLDWKLEALLKYAGGGTFPNLTQDTIRDFEIPFPEHRRKIAAILSSYDDLIENNLRRIKILEEMAQNLYREWFVKFRFPGHQHARFTDSPLGRIPDGWEVVPLEDIVNLCRKGVQPQNFPDELFEHFSFPAYDSGKLPAIEKGQTIKSGKYEVPLNCVLVPKLNPHIPRVWLPRPSNDIRSIASTEYLILEPKKYSTAFYYVLFSSPEMVEKLAGRADGTSTSHKRLKPGDFLEQLTVAPPDSLTEAFDSLVVPAMDLVISLIYKNTALRRTRDLLLPRLISGEVDMSELDITIPKEFNA